MRTNRPINAAQPRHRKAGPARLGGDGPGGKRARELTEEDVAEERASGQGDGAWPSSASGR